MNNNGQERESIEELRRRHFEDLGYSSEAPKAPNYTPNFGTSANVPVTPAKRKRKRNSFLPAFLGAIVGGIVVLVAVFTFLYFSGYFTTATVTTTTGSTSGPVINYTGGNTATEVEAVAQVVPTSVVGVLVEGTETATDLFGQPSTQAITSFGSGFFVTDDGYIVTNQHVIGDDPQSITISTDSGESYDAQAIWSDASLDIAVLKCNAVGVQPLNLGDSDDLRVGQTVVAVGNPLGLNYSRTVTAGIISALNRTLINSNNQVEAEGLIQIDAAINSGNSGGPLVNVNGEVIGINTYKSAAGEGIGFAIPINLFKPIIQEVIQTGDFSPRLIGVTGYDPEQAKYTLNGQVTGFTTGFYIMSVTPGSPAQQAGLQQGDIIKTVDGKEINTLLQMRTILYNHQLSDRVPITYERDGQIYSAELSLTSATQ